MKSVRTFKRRCVLSSLAAGPFLCLPRRALASEGIELSIMHTNDTHSRIEPFESGKFKGRVGVARRATVFARIREASEYTLALDAGDTFQGTPWFNAFRGAVDMSVMDRLDYDATCIGNHDFDAGPDSLMDALELAPRMAALAANYKFEPISSLRKRVSPHVVIERGGCRIGVFGLGINFDGLVNPALHRGVSYSDPREAARESVALLRQSGCDAIIAVSHLGHRGFRGEVGDTDWPKDVPGVNYVVGGHTHTFLRRPDEVVHKSGWRTAVMQVGHSGLNIGHATLRIDKRGKADVVGARCFGVGGRAIV